MHFLINGGSLNHVKGIHMWKGILSLSIKFHVTIFLLIFIKGFQFLEASSLSQRLSFKGSLCQVHQSWGWELVLHMIPTHRKRQPFIFQVFHVKSMEVLLTFTSLQNTSTD